MPLFKPEKFLSFYLQCEKIGTSWNNQHQSQSKLKNSLVVLKITFLFYIRPKTAKIGNFKPQILYFRRKSSDNKIFH